MSTWYDNIKAFIANNIRPNRKREITGEKMNTVLNGIVDEVENKVDKEEGKGLSTNDYTDADKAKVASAVQTETDPTVPSWAKQQNKPSYDYSEIGNTPDLSGFITKSVNDLTNYYLKSETYTKAEVAALIGAIQQFHYEIYATLPQSGESNVLYLIGPTGSGSDKYEEYVYANNDFTKIGDTSIDLSGYVTTSALNTALADYTTTASLTALLSNKADKVANATNGNFAGLDANGNSTDSGKKASDFATASQGAKADTAYQKPSSGIPESDLSSDVRQALQKHFKGWLESTADLPVNPVVGDYAYVEDNGTTYIYRCTTDGEWPSTSTEEKDPADVTFASSQKVNEVHIVNDFVTGRINDVASAAIVKQLRDSGYLYAGIATPSSTPVSTNAKIFYIAKESGTYTNYGGWIVENGNLGVTILKKDGDEWSVDAIPSELATCTVYISSNLYNKDDAGCEDLRQIYINGNINSSTKRKISAYIPVKPSTYYVGQNVPKISDSQTVDDSVQICWYDENKDVITWTDPEGAKTLATARQSPANAAYIRVTMVMADDVTNGLYEGQTLPTYEPYGLKTVTYQLNTSILEDVIPSDAEDSPIDDSGFDIVSGDNVQEAFDSVDDALGLVVEKHISTNLYNKDDADCEDYYYVRPDTGNLGTSQTLKASGWIPVTPGTYYIGYLTNMFCWYDSTKTALPGQTSTTNLNLEEAKQAPQGAAYIRVSFKMETDSSNRLNEGQTLLDYEPYGDSFVKKDSDTGIISQSYNLTGSMMLENKVPSMGNGDTLSIDSVPENVRTTEIISFYSDLSEIGSGNSIEIGKGASGTYSSRIIIDDTDVKRYSGASTLIGSEEHGLNISSYIKVTIVASKEDWKVYLSTLADSVDEAGVFVATLSDDKKCGTVYVKSNGVSLTNCKLTYECCNLRKPIWAFGDSYFGYAGNNREMYWLDQWGYYDNMLVCSKAGISSSGIKTDFDKLIAIGKPKIIIWCLGMNDSDLSIYIATLTNIRNTCNKYGITLIVATIPPVPSKVAVNNAINAYIASEELRYIDVAKAVGANTSNGTWYGEGTDYDYLESGSSRVHPTMYGAKAIAAQFLVDVPEIMQY